MTDRIPKEIMREAEKTLDLMLCNCREAGDVRQDSILDIARALLSRDQRAAEIARNAGKYHLDAAKMGLPIEPSPIIAKDRAHIAQRIAAAILSYDEARHD